MQTIGQGQIVDQQILNDIIKEINNISSKIYTSKSSISKVGEESTGNATVTDNGSWVVATVYDSISGKIPKTTGSIFNLQTRNFGVTFSEPPIVTGTIYCKETDDPIWKVVSTVVINEVTTSSFKYKVLSTGLDSNPDTTFGVMFTAIGKSQSTSTLAAG